MGLLALSNPSPFSSGLGTGHGRGVINRSSMSLCLFVFKQEPDTFEYAFENMGTSVGGGQLRYNFYPTIPDISQVKPGQIRCGEHTDYGRITLLIQDDVGGLEVPRTLFFLPINTFLGLPTREQVLSWSWLAWTRPAVSLRSSRLLSKRRANERT